MSKNILLIVESPAKAKTIEKFLGKDYIVKSSFGHIRDLSKKELGIDIEAGYRPCYEVSADKRRLVEELERLLDITPGSLSVLGLMNDHDGDVSLLIDEDLMASEYFGCHPCVNTSSLRMRVEDLIHIFLPAVGHTYRTVRLMGE